MELYFVTHHFLKAPLVENIMKLLRLFFDSILKGWNVVIIVLRQSINWHSAMGNLNKYVLFTIRIRVVIFRKWIQWQRLLNKYEFSHHSTRSRNFDKPLILVWWCESGECVHRSFFYTYHLCLQRYAPPVTLMLRMIDSCFPVAPISSFSSRPTQSPSRIHNPSKTWDLFPLGTTSPSNRWSSKIMRISQPKTIGPGIH